MPMLRMPDVAASLALVCRGVRIMNSRRMSGKRTRRFRAAR